jgi:hypothetical protein
MTQGASLRASENSAATCFSASPNHLDMSAEADTEMKCAPHSAASALASSVLPVPLAGAGGEAKGV